MPPFPPKGVLIEVVCYWQHERFRVSVCQLFDTVKVLPEGFECPVKVGCSDTRNVEILHALRFHLKGRQ